MPEQKVELIVRRCRGGAELARVPATIAEDGLLRFDLRGVPIGEEVTLHVIGTASRPWPFIVSPHPVEEGRGRADRRRERCGS